MHAQGRFLGLLLGTWFLRTPRRKYKEITRKVCAFPHDQLPHTHTHMHTTTGMFSATYQVEKIKPNVFVCFTLAAFQVFKFLDNILN